MGSMSKLETCLFDGCANGIINGKNIRGGVSDKDGENIWSTFDFINAVCGREISDAYGKNIYFNICKNDQSQDVKNLSSKKQRRMKNARPQLQSQNATLSTTSLCLCLLRLALTFQRLMIRTGGPTTAPSMNR
jgi:hypothetical protein